MRYFPHLLLNALFLAVVVPAHSASWLTDYGSAKLRLAAENKPILMLFTGSDWSAPCQKLRQDVFSKAEFAAFAETNLILLEVDFPRYRALSGAQKQANASLADRYKVQFYPTMILLDTRGEEVARPRYDGRLREFLAGLDLYAQKSSPDSRRKPGSKDAEAAAPPADVPLFNGAAAGPAPRFTDLVLKSISGTHGRRLALINNQTFAPGDVARVKLEDAEVNVRCLEIRAESVLVAVDGQPGQRELKVAARH